MTAPLWQAGTLYPNGSIVQPQTVAPPVSTTIPNPGFESGDVDWDKDAGWTINNTGESFTGSWSAEFNATATDRKITGQTLIPVVPGQSITLTCQVQQGASSAGQAGARVALAWFDAADVELSESLGNLVDSASGGAWRQSSVTGIAPAGAAKVAQRAIGFRNSGSAALWVDTFAWNYVAPASLSGLIYKAVQPTTGSSGTTEPAWPSTPGLTVVDNEVTWECIAATRVTWEAHPLLVSGSPEPTWPIVPGGTVADGNLIWVASSRRVEDENCPNTKVVAIIASHVFAVDVDIVRFSAAINPLDWTTESNAGFLPTGLQQANANNMAVLGTYRKNLVPMNANVLQLWAMDPDPELMQPIDQLDGIGSIFHWAATAVADDLFYLAALGVRSVSMSGASRNLSSGDIGEPVDELVQQAMAWALAAGVEPISTYYPGLGQYLLAFPGYPPDELLISGNLGDQVVGALIAPYSYTATGGTPAYDFTIVSGALPAGLVLSSDGIVTGTPEAEGTFSWTVRVTDQMEETANLPDGCIVTAASVSLVCSSGFYSGDASALVYEGEINGGAFVDDIRVSDDGNLIAYVFGAVNQALAIKTFNAGTQSWDAIAVPGGLTTTLVKSVAWSPSFGGDYYLAVKTTAPGQFLALIKVSGGVATLISSEPASPPTGKDPQVKALAWDFSGARIAGEFLGDIYVYDFDAFAEAFVDPRFVASGVNAVSAHWQQEADSDYLAIGSFEGVLVVRDDAVSLVIAASVTSGVEGIYGRTVWNATSQYLVTAAVGDAAGAVQVLNWDGTFDAESITLNSTSADTVAFAKDVSINTTGSHIAYAFDGVSSPAIFALGASLPPAPVLIASPAASIYNLNSVDFK